MKTVARHCEVLCNIALEKSREIINMRNDQEFSKKGHNEVKDILNDMIRSDYYNAKEATLKEVDENSKDAIIQRFFDINNEITSLRTKAQKINQKTKEIQKMLG